MPRNNEGASLQIAANSSATKLILAWGLCQGLFLLPFIVDGSVVYIALSGLGGFQEPPADQFDTIPSPSGALVAQKRYRRDTVYELSVTGIPHTDPPHTVSILQGPNTRKVIRGDGVIVGWDGDNHLIVGWPEAWPTGLPTVPGPSKIADLNITYLKYKEDPFKGLLQDSEAIALTGVRYRFEELRESSSYAHCVIHILGVDGRVFANVALDIDVHGILGHKTPPADYGLANFDFKLTPLPNGLSPRLTPTQAKLDDIFPDFSPPSFFGGTPRQNGETLSYGPFVRDDVAAAFRLLRAGHYKLYFALTFGKQDLLYSVDTPIPKEVGERYESCEAANDIFRQPAGQLLTRQQ